MTALPDVGAVQFRVRELAVAEPTVTLFGEEGAVLVSLESGQAFVLEDVIGSHDCWG